MKLTISQNNKPLHQVAIIAAVVMIGVGLAPKSCFGWQSGSRSAPSAAAISPQPSFSAPAVQSQFNQQFSQQQLSQPFTNSIQQPFVENLAPQSFSTPGSFELQNNGGVNLNVPTAGSGSSQALPQAQAQNAPSQGGSSSPGIPEAAVVDPIFEINNPNSFVAVDHSAWNAFLAKYVAPDSQGLTRVCYRNVSSADYQNLLCYLQQLQSIDVRQLNRSEQLAYWFNLYNARTIAVVLENYPIRSVRQIKEKFTDFVGPFDDEGAVVVLGKSLSLNDIESGVIRPIFNDPRIHYALNCASYGCPNLATTAWQSHDIDARLNNAAYEYINSGRAVKTGILGLRTSKIYKWYAGDFGGEAGVLNHLRQYANGDTLQRLNGQTSIRGYFYDWSLNDARVQRRRILEPLIR